MPGIETSLGTLRRKRGISAAHLADAVNVSRQTIYAMEAGTYVPNTAVALRLARTLDTTVEAIFALVEDAPRAESRSEQATLLPGSASLEAGQAVQLCRVDDRLIASALSPGPWYLPATEAALADRPVRKGKTRIHMFETEKDFSQRVLVAGCDPGISVLSRHVQTAGVELVLAHRNSSQALAFLRDGCVHVAGTHLRDAKSGEPNLPAISRLFPQDSVAVVSFAVWEEGILAAKGNPKNIRTIEDFTRKDIRMVNREEGSGSRALLDDRFKIAGIKKKDVQGYENCAAGHLQSAWQVSSGAADCGLATRAAARALGLTFIPLVTERYDLVVRKQHLDLPSVKNMLDVLSRASFRRELEFLGGYNARVAGERQL